MSAIAETAANGIEQQLQAIKADGGMSDAMEAAFAILDTCVEFALAEGVTARELLELVYPRVDDLETLANSQDAAERAEEQDDGA